MPSTYDVVRLDDEGCWQTLLSNVDYNKADMEVDRYTDQFPNACIDILPHKGK
jgi:hypothetical protein